MKLMDLTVKGFVDEVAASSPAPGGGSVSALAAALAAALVSMVGSLTLRKLDLRGVRHTGDAATQAQMACTDLQSSEAGGTVQRNGARTQQPDIEADMTLAVEIAGDLRRHFERLVDEDAAAFDAVMAAYRLPRSTSEERESRSAAIQEALKEACRVPSEVAKGAVEVLRLSDLVAREGVQSALSDAAVACLAADAALHGAYLNVLMNLGSIKDQAFVAAVREEMAKAVRSGEAIRDQVMGLVHKALECHETGPAGDMGQGLGWTGAWA